jgi:hypothetical protein
LRDDIRGLSAHQLAHVEQANVVPVVTGEPDDLFQKWLLVQADLPRDQHADAAMSTRTSAMEGKRGGGVAVFHLKLMDG